MNKYEKMLSGPQYNKHPLENCVLRTEPTGIGGWHTFVKFQGEEEYPTVPPDELVISSLWKNEPEWISQEQYLYF